MKIEDMIIEIELLALAHKKDHDNTMNTMVAIGKIADDKIADYKQLAEDFEHIANMGFEISDSFQDDVIQVEEEKNVFIACTIMFGLSTLVLAGILSYVL